MFINQLEKLSLDERYSLKGKINFRDIEIKLRKLKEMLEQIKNKYIFKEAIISLFYFI